MSIRLQRAELISFIVLIGFFFSVAFHYVLHFYLHRSYPYSTFLFDPGDRLADYTNVIRAVGARDPYHYQGGGFGNYFPFTYLTAIVFGALRRPGLLLFLALFVAGSIAYFARRSGLSADPQITPLARVRLVFVLVLMSYPVLFELDRANFEALTFLLMAAGALLIGSGRYRQAAVPLALAIAMKGYPVLFLLLYLPARKYREAALSLGLAVAVCLAGFSVLHGGLIQNLHGLSADLKVFLSVYVIHGGGATGARLNCSLFAPLGLLDSNPAFLRRALLFYNAFSLLAGVLLLWLAFARRMERWKLEYLLAAAGLLLPSISYDYKLLVLFIPLASFLRDARRDRADAFYCASFGAMLIPKDYLFLGNGVSISSVLEPLILLATVAVIVRDVLGRRAAEGDVPADAGTLEAGGRQLSR